MLAAVGRGGGRGRFSDGGDVDAVWWLDREVAAASWQARPCVALPGGSLSRPARRRSILFESLTRQAGPMASAPGDDICTTEAMARIDGAMAHPATREFLPAAEAASADQRAGTSRSGSEIRRREMHSRWREVSVTRWRTCVGTGVAQRRSWLRWETVVGGQRGRWH